MLIPIGAATLYFMFTSFNSIGTTVAFADVAQKIKSAHTLTCTGTATFPGKPGVAMKFLLSDPDRIRTEAPGGMVGIIAVGRSILALNDKTHTATRMEFTGEGPGTVPKVGPISIVEAFRKDDDAKGEPLGDKTIDGIPVTGFRTKLQDQSTTVWAARKDGNPVRIEMAISVGVGDAQMVFDHIEIDPPLDEALFSTDTPAGYTLVTKTLELPKIGELADAVAKILGDYADVSNDAFPASLTAWNDFIKADAAGIKEHPDKKHNLTMRIGAISGIIFSESPGSWGYAGKDVKRGDPNRIIFWYQPKPGTESYRAVFGDLHIAEVTKNQPPVSQPTTLP